MIIQNKRNLTIHNSIDEAKAYIQNRMLSISSNFKEGEVLHTRYKSGGGVYDLAATLYLADTGKPFCYFNEITPEIPSISNNSKNDIVEVYVGFESSDAIRRLLLGGGLKCPYNFVMKYNRISYDPTFDINKNKPGVCQISNKSQVCIIESMNYPKWLHTCNIDLVNFNGDKNGTTLALQNVYIPTSLYVKDDEDINIQAIHSFLMQFHRGFYYQNNGSISPSDVPISKFPQIDPSQSVFYKIQPNTKYFFDSTIFFNQAMQGKYIPFIWGGKLKYFHFNHELL